LLVLITYENILVVWHFDANNNMFFTVPN